MKRKFENYLLVALMIMVSLLGVTNNPTSVLADEKDYDSDKLTIAKTVVDADGDGYASAGEALTYTISVKNIGKKDQDDVKVKDSVEHIKDYIVEDLDDVDVTITGGQRPKTIALVSFKNGYIISEIKKGKTYTFTFTVTMSSDLTETKTKSICNTAFAGNKSVSVTINVKDKYVDLVSEKIVKDADEDGYVSANEALAYTIKITNNGTISATDVSVKDTLAELESYMQEDPKDVIVQIESSSPYTVSLKALKEGINIHSISANETVTLNFVITMKSTLSEEDITSIRNTASVEDDNPSISIPVKDKFVALNTTKTVVDADGDGYAMGGEMLEYIIQITNNGNIDAYDVTLREDLIAMEEYIEEDLEEVSVTTSPRPMRNPFTLKTLVDGIVIPKLEANETISFRYRVTTISSLRTEDIERLVNYTHTNDDLNSASIDVKDTIVDIDVRKTVSDGDGDGSVAANEEVIYELTITNNGNVTTDVDIRNTFEKLLPYIVQKPDAISVEIETEDTYEVISADYLVDGIEWGGLEVGESIIVKFKVILKDNVKFSRLASLMNTSYVNNEPYQAEIPVERAPYQIVYNGNGNTKGKVPVDTNRYLDVDEVTILDGKDLLKGTSIFKEWNTKQDGSGTGFSGNEKMEWSELSELVMEETLADDTIELYAIWQESKVTAPKDVENKTKVDTSKVDTSDPTTNVLYTITLTMAMAVTAFAIASLKRK